MVKIKIGKFHVGAPILAIFFACCLLGFYAAFIEPFKLKVTAWTVASDKWTYSHDLKIALLSDPHMIWPFMTAAHLESIVKKTNELNPDVVLILGDYVGTHPFGLQIDPDRGMAPLKNLKAQCGTYAVLGNHDLHPVSAWPEALARTGIPVLQNKTVPVNCRNQKIWIGGLEDLWWQKPDILKTLSFVTDKNPVIMMMHNPDMFADMPPSVTLSVAGHTHGGQIRFPFIGAVAAVIPSRYGKRYVYGHIVEDGKDLIVSSGLGMTGLPLRFLTPPEVTMVTLTRKQN